MATITTTDLPEAMASTIRYADTPVTDLVVGQTFRQVRMGREERHLSVTSVRRLNVAHGYMVVSYQCLGRSGEVHLRVGTYVEVVANF